MGNLYNILIGNFQRNILGGRTKPKEGDRFKIEVRYR
jgi:hypothetical protein